MTPQTATPVQTLHELTGDAPSRGETLEGLEATRPSLEDVYLELTTEADANGVNGSAR